MTVIAIVPALALILGLLVWFAASNPKVSEAGKWLYVTGLLVTLFALAGHVIHLP